VTRANARLLGRLLAEIERLDDGEPPIMEIYRRVGLAADHLGLTRPSYEQVRVHVHALRRLRRVSRLEILADVATRVRPPSALHGELLDPPLKRY
jgi:hypothetical protein